MPALNSISPAALLRLIGTPDCPMIVDISIDPDFEEDPFFIPGAFRYPHTDVSGLIRHVGNNRIVVTCQRGIKLSQGLVARLRCDGLDAQYLEGGNHGWRDLDGAPRIPAKSIPETVDGATLWVTRRRPKIDRIACPWLIRRFIDPDARFLFVSPAEVLGVADRYAATPFDTDGAPFSDKGDRCSFDAMLDAYGLHTEALDKLALVIRAADTGQHALHPAAAGLLTISVGLSRQVKDDVEQLNQGMVIYDALYRWARDGQDETHGGPRHP